MDIGPEISDLIVDYDSNSLERLSVSKARVIETFTQLKNRNAIKIVNEIQERSGDLNPDAVDDILLRTHYELQRVSELFEQGGRVAEVLRPLLRAIRRMDGGTELSVRVVDIGCGIGYVPRGLAANMSRDPLCICLMPRLLGVALLVRSVPSVDARTMSQVIVLGPMTFTRHVVAVLGVIYAATGVKHAEVMIAIVPIVSMMLMMQPFFDRLNRYPDFKARQARRPS